MTTDALRHLDAESWLARRLDQFREGTYRAVFAGLTDTSTRRERMRDAILDLNLGLVIAGRGQDGKPETFGEVFQRLYREPLRAAA